MPKKDSPEQAEKYPLLTRKYGQLYSESFPPYPVTVNIDILTVEEIERLKHEAEVKRKRAEIDQIMQFVYNIQNEFYQSGFIKFPIPSLFEYERNTKTMAVNKLHGKIDETQAKIDKIHETTKILNDAVFSPKIKRKIENYAYDISIVYKTGGRSSTSRRIHWSEYQALADLTTEKIECLKEAERFHDKVIAIHKKELKWRTMRKTEIPIIIEKLTQLCKDAEKCRKQVVKVNEKVFKSDKPPSFAEAEIFIKNREQFKKCSREYHALKDKLRFITDEKISFPQFSKGLTIDVTSRRRQFEKVYRQGGGEQKNALVG